MRKNILITGVHGYIGNALKDKLIEQGHQVDQINVRNQLWKSTSFKDYDYFNGYNFWFTTIHLKQGYLIICKRICC